MGGKVNLGCVFNIQRFCVHDGPGIRDVIFLKGCTMKCKWCCNPESQSADKEIAFKQDVCLGSVQCGRCINACPSNAIIESKNDKSAIEINRELCVNCSKCATICPARAITVMGKLMSVNEVINAVKDNSIFYRRSGGGLTVSGGEPALQAEFVECLLRTCKEMGLDTAIETCGYAKWEDLRRSCEYANLIFYDIKCLDPKKHKDFTGVDNELIIGNLIKLSHQLRDTSVIVRTPIIPDFNDNQEDVRSILKFISKLNNIKQYELLKYHSLGEVKYKQLGRKYELSNFKPVNEKKFKELQKISKEL
ncbi:MAG: glycyl-radical enzyme activating protein [Bacillota bacterium]